MQLAWSLSLWGKVSLAVLHTVAPRVPRPLCSSSRPARASGIMTPRVCAMGQPQAWELGPLLPHFTDAAQRDQHTQVQRQPF